VEFSARFRRERQLPQQMPSEIPALLTAVSMTVWEMGYPLTALGDVLLIAYIEPKIRQDMGSRRFPAWKTSQKDAPSFGERAVQFHIFIFL